METILDDELRRATDGELLRRYAAGDGDAFAALVRRHVDMVHGAARRMLAGAAAEDLVQAVFLLLAQRARRLTGRPTVAGWLYRVTGYCCRNVQKAEGRRRRRERKAAAMRDEAGVGVDVGAALDEGLRRLGEVADALEAGR